MDVGAPSALFGMTTRAPLASLTVPPADPMPPFGDEADGELPSPPQPAPITSNSGPPSARRLPRVQTVRATRSVVVGSAAAGSTRAMRSVMSVVLLIPTNQPQKARLTENYGNARPKRTWHTHA